MPRAAEADSLAQAAWLANGKAVIDVPSGIGFCLYIRGACMSRLLNLSEQFDKGYYEDVDLCLRAERAGWRNVCATGVYVAHHGSRSFRDTKAYLAARNRSVLDRLYPAYAKRSATWLAEDPLRTARANIERSLPPAKRPSTLLLVGDDHSRRRAEDYARGLALKERIRPLVALIQREGGRRVLRIQAVDGDVPHNLFVPIDGVALTEMETVLIHNRVQKVVVFDPAAVDTKLLDCLRSCVKIELREGDAGIFCPRRNLIGPDDRYCGIPTDTKICEECIGIDGSGCHLRDAGAISAWRASWSNLVFHQSQASRRRYIARFANLSGKCFDKSTAFRRAAARSLDPAVPPRLAIIPLATCASDTKLVSALADGWPTKSGCDLLILGNMLDKRRYSDRDGIVHLAHIEPDEIEAALNLHGATHVFMASRSFVFATPLMRRSEAWVLPVAQFQYPFQNPSRASYHRLLLNIEESDDAVAERLHQWVHASSTSQAFAAESSLL